MAGKVNVTFAMTASDLIFSRGSFQGGSSRGSDQVQGVRPSPGGQTK